MTAGYLIFIVAGRRFGVRLTGALEILPWRRARSVPLSYPYVEGLIDYRGTVYPIFNLTQRLGLSRTAPIGFTAGESGDARGGQSIILLEENNDPFGIIVDSVVKMAPLGEPSGSARIPGVDPRFVRGSVIDDDQEVIILDFERLLNAG